MGPAPLYAIRNGEVYIGYDTGFVFAEVNADCVRWTVRRDESRNIVIEGRWFQGTQNNSKCELAT